MALDAATGRHIWSHPNRSNAHQSRLQLLGE